MSIKPVKMKNGPGEVPASIGTGRFERFRHSLCELLWK
jgi:hypothetical protein